MGDKTQIAGY